MTDENVNEETQDEAAEPETTDAPEGVTDVENVPEETASEEVAPATEPEPRGEAAQPEPTAEAEDPQPDEPQPAEPVAEAETNVESETAREEAAPAPEPEPRGEAAQSEPAAAPVKKKRKRLPRALRRQRSKPIRERPAERKAIARLPKPEHERGRRQERQGTVVSAGADKTIVVRVDVVKVHPMYKKVIKRSTKLHAHDETNEAKVGDIVRLVETRPLSKLKRWRLQEVVEAAK